MPRPLLHVALLAALAAAGSASAQTLYATEENDTTLVTVDPATGATLTEIGSLAPSDGIVYGRAIAMDPTDGTLYTVYEPGPGRRTSPAYGLAIVDLDTAAVTTVGYADVIRDLTFDEDGKLWAVSGGDPLSVPAHALLSIDTADASVSVENASLPTIRNKLAYRTVSDEVFVFGYDTTGMVWRMHRFSPDDPTTLTEVALSGDPLADDRTQPPMVYERPMDRFLTTESPEWYAIDPDGVVTLLNTNEAPPMIENLGGLAFDRKTTAERIFSDDLESGDTELWDATVGSR